MTSVRLTLWLIGLLTVAMAVATLIPQNAPTEAYLKVFGTLFGAGIARSTLRNIYGSWWFVGSFALLALNLLACAIQRTGVLLRQEREAPGPVTRADVEGCGHLARWRIASDVETAARSLAGRLRRMGYAVAEAPGEAEGQRGLVGRRGRLQAWVPVIVHAGMVIVLLGAAWGRWPAHAFHASVPLDAGQTTPIRAGDEAFGLRLVDAGTERDAKGSTSNYWAKVEVLEEGTVVRRATIQSNHPLRYHAVSATLASLSSAGYGVEVSGGEMHEMIPVTQAPDGSVSIRDSYLLLENHTILMVEAVRERDEEGREAPAALVNMGHMDKSGHNFQPIGWVGPEGRDAMGLHFRLVGAGGRATLTLDRDVGVPIVFLGFAVLAGGALLLLTTPRRRVTALVTSRGRGTQVVVGVSPTGGGGSAERVFRQLETKWEATREREATRVEEEET